jgi:hypothetical protein
MKRSRARNARRTPQIRGRRPRRRGPAAGRTCEAEDCVARRAQRTNRAPRSTASAGQSQLGLSPWPASRSTVASPPPHFQSYLESGLPDRSAGAAAAALSSRQHSRRYCRTPDPQAPGWYTFSARLDTRRRFQKSLRSTRRMPAGTREQGGNPSPVSSLLVAKGRAKEDVSSVAVCIGNAAVSASLPPAILTIEMRE